MLTEITSTLLAFTEIGGNRLLSMDDRVLARCSELQGSCIKIHLTDLDLSLYCHPGSCVVASLHYTAPSSIER